MLLPDAGCSDYGERPSQRAQPALTYLLTVLPTSIFLGEVSVIQRSIQQTVWRPVEAVRDAVLLLLAPQPCRQCGALVECLNDGVVCRTCWETWRAEHATYLQVCDRCGYRAAAHGPAVVRRDRCEQCARWSLTWVRSGGVYTGALRAAVLALKRSPAVPVPLWTLLQETWQVQTVLHASDLIVPIPLAPLRQRLRGYNQAEILAKALARTTCLPVVTEALVRCRETHPHRAGLDAQARRAALHGAFQVLRPRLIAGRHILLVDDVLTSGATLDTAARSLLAAGAAAVSALTVARAAVRRRASFE